MDSTSRARAGGQLGAAFSTLCFGSVALEVRLGARATAASSPNGELLMRAFAQARRPGPWRPERDRLKAAIARALRWAPECADDAKARRAFRGRGGERAALARRFWQLVPVKLWDEDKALRFRLEKCCEWVDYVRERDIQSAEQLSKDLRHYGILGVRPPALLKCALRTIAHALPGAERAYRQRR